MSNKIGDKMAFELWSLPPLPDSPVAPLQRLYDGSVHTVSGGSSSPDKRYTVMGRVAAADRDARDKPTSAALSPNKRSPNKPETYRSQSPFPSSSRKPTSPTKVPLPPSPTHAQVSPLKPLSAAESSFLLPANLSDSMIGETSMPTMLMDESLDFGMSSINGARGLPKKHDMGYRHKLDSVIEGSTTPTRTISKVSETPKVKRTTESATTPKTAKSSRKEHSSPTKTPATSRPTRTVPVSSSHPAIARCIEAGDVSTLLPVSPARTAHLTRDEHQLLRESLPMSDGPSFFLPPPPSSTRKTPRKPNKADMTLDINDLMAKMAKPKRPSGTEESFEDLLNGPDLEFDKTMIGNETFLPANLRHRPKAAVSPVKHTPARIRNAAQVELEYQQPSTTKSPMRLEAQDSPKWAMQSPTRPIGTLDTPGVPRVATAPRTPAAAAAASPCRHVPATTGRRVSLSTGALPMPSSATQPKLSTPSMARAGHVRSGSTVSATPGASGLSRASSTRTTTASGPTSLSRTPASRTLADAAPGRNGSPARPNPLAPRNATVAPRTSHARTGSTASLTAPARTAPTSSRPGLATTSSSSRPASFRPTSQAQPAKSSLPPTATSARLPLPGTGSSARSALDRPSGSITTTSRVFGNDGASTTNRMSSRPVGASALAPGRFATTVSGKHSMAPPASPVKRDLTTTLKSRAASTPAENVTRLTRPTTTTKSSIPPGTTARSVTQTRSALPRPQTSRMPTATGAASKLPSASSRNSASIQALRAKIDALSAKQGVSRR